MGSSPSAGTSDQSPQLGRFHVIEEVSRTVGSVVYKARDPLIDRLVLLKTLAVGLPDDEVREFRKRVDRELKSAGRLNHPNIVTIYDVGFTDDAVYIATEFIDGRSLREMLRSGARPMPARAAEIAAQIADGLDFVHERGLVHRNISPETITVLRSGAVKITEFGIARPSRGQHTLIADLGASPRYTSPEQVTGGRVDERSDIFSLGAVLYELLTGTPPFAPGRLYEVAYQVVNKMPPAPSTCTHGVAPAFDSIVEKAMAKHPHDRYRTAREMAADLRAAVKLSPVLEAKTASDAGEASSNAVWAWRPQPFLLYGAVVLLLLATAVVAPNRQQSPALSPASALTPTAGSSVATTIAHRDPVSTSTSPPEEPTPSHAGTTASKDRSVSASSSTAQITLAIRPWGVVYVNGKKKGLSPPLRELLLVPGTYIVEIRNDNFPPYRERIDVRRGTGAKIAHSFSDTSADASKEGARRQGAARQGTPLLSEEWPR